MSEKKQKSFTVDLENAELCEEHDNASALVNDLLEQYRKGSDEETAGFDVQIDQKQKELRERQKGVKRIQQDIQQLKQLKAGVSKKEDAKLEEARDALENVPLEVGNPAVENWAGGLGMTQQELINELSK